MAGSSVSHMKLELPPQPVQELIKQIGEQVPERYLCPENTQPNPEVMESNIIDLHLLSASSSPENEEELQKLRLALSSWGCFQLRNHGMTSLMDQVREASKHFFELPLEAKQKYSRSLDSIQGYGGNTISANLPINWNDRLRLMVYPADQRDLKFWPEDVTNFRETLDEYATQIKKVKDVIMKSIAKSLTLEEDIFNKHNDSLFATFNFYPPCPCPERVIGLRPHSDSSVITILLQDKLVEGLQVQRDNRWFEVPVIPDALFINVGDQLEIMSNGMLKSAVHKVVTDRKRERISVAMFCAPNTDTELGPLPELIDDERPPLYKTVKNYSIIYFQCIARGERAINAVKI